VSFARRTCAPARTYDVIVTAKWYASGSVQRILSSGPSARTSPAAVTRASTSACERMTPLRSAVVPDVNRTKAGVSLPNSDGPGRASGRRASTGWPSSETTSVAWTSVSSTIVSISAARSDGAIGTTHAPAPRIPNAAGT
jgi:hypothetical protein